MITIKINDQEKQIPESWDDKDCPVTFGQYLELLNDDETIDNDISHVLSIFLGLSPEVIRFAKITNIEQVIQALSFITETTPNFQGKVDEFMGVQIPADITFEQLAPFEDMRSLMRKTTKDTPFKDRIAQYAKYVAIYVQLKRDPEYSYEKAMQIVPAVMIQPCQDVIILGSFFLIKVARLTRSITPSSQSQS